MNPLAELLFRYDPWLLLALHALLQTTLISLMALVLAATVARSQPASRHGILLAALVLMLVGPVVATVAGGLGLSLLRIDLPRPEPLGGESAAAAPILDGAGPAAGESPGVGAHDLAARPSMGSSAASMPIPWLRALAGIWAAGALFLTARLAHGLWLGRRLRRGAQPLTDPGALFARLDAVFGRDLRGRVLVSSSVDRPLALGIGDPVVLLPARIAAGLPAEQLSDVVLHECAHLVRRDPWVGLLQRVATVLYWPQPLLLFLNRALARSREEVCDDHVLRHGSAPHYARALLAVSESLDRSLPTGTPPGVALGLLAPRWSLEARIDGLLHKERVPMIRPRLRTLAPVALLLVGLSVLLAGVQLSPAAAADPPHSARPQEAPKLSDADQAVVEALRATGTLQFEDQPLEELLAFFGMLTQTSVQLRLDDVKRTSAIGATRINLKLTDLAAGNALALVLRQVDLTYRIRDGKVVILEHKAAAELPLVSLVDPKDEKKARRKLAKVEVTLDLEGAPLGEVLQALARSSGVNIVMDTLALQKAGKGRDTQVGEVKAQGAILKVLEQLLDPLRLALLYKHEVILITTPEQVNKEQRARRR